MVVDEKDFDEEEGEVGETGFDTARENLRVRRESREHVDRVFDAEE